MPEKSKENAEKSPKIIKNSRNNMHFVLPGGYFCGEKIDELAVCNAEILRILEQITNTPGITKEEIFRLLSKIYNQVHSSDKALIVLRIIYK